MMRTTFRTLIGAYAWHEPGRTVLTLIGVALGVAVLVAMNLAIESALGSFKQNLRDLAGRADLIIRGNTTGIPGHLVGVVSKFSGVRSAAPLIQGQAIFVDQQRGTSESMILLGVDLLNSRERESVQVREVNFELAPGISLSDLLNSGSHVILTRAFADQTGMKLGAAFTVEISGHSQELIFAGSLKGGPLENINRGAVILADIGIADVLLNRHGLLDNMDVILEDKSDEARIATTLRERLPASVIIESPSDRSLQADQMLAAFRFNLNALGYISLLVGAFLIFNTLQIAVIRRAPQIGTLRAIGVSRAAIRASFLIEGALLGILGGALGLIGGVSIAANLLKIVTTAISINFIHIEHSKLQLSWPVLAQAWCLGVAFAVAAAWGPANLAAATPPANTMRRGALEGRLSGQKIRLISGAVSLLVAALILKLPGEQGLPLAGYSASMLITLAFVFWARPLLSLIISITRRPLALLFRAEGLIASAGARGALPRSGVAISGLLVALGMALSVGVMVASFRDTVISWMTQVLRADLYLSAAESENAAIPEPLPIEMARVIERLPGILQIDPFRMRDVTIDGLSALLGAGTFNMVRYAAEYRILDGRLGNEVIRAAARDGEVIVSQSFARKHKTGQGAIVRIPTPKGAVPLKIAGVFFDYSAERGYVIMDRGLYMKLFNDPAIDSVAVYLKPDADLNQTRRLIEMTLSSVPGLPRWSLRVNRDLRAAALQAFDRTFQITRVMQLVAVIIAVLGIANTLLAQIIDRRDEIATLRTIGARRGRVAKIIMIESGLIGLAGVLAGTCAGLLLAWVLARVIMLQSFGWTLQFHIPWLLVLQIVGIVFISTLIAGIIPARQAARIRTLAG